MPEVVYRPEAKTDIDGVAEYTIAQWGHDQAVEYVRDLRRSIEAIAGSVTRYPVYDRVHPGLRRKRSGMHHVYFLASNDRVEIVRIMHVQRDPGLLLRGLGGETSF